MFTSQLTLPTNVEIPGSQLRVTNAQLVFQSITMWLLYAQNIFLSSDEFSCL